MSHATPPAGWYDDPTVPGGQRWWDGSRWTEHTHQGPPPVVRSEVMATASNEGQRHRELSESSDGRRWWRRKRVLIPAGVMLLFVAASTLVDEPEPDAATSGTVVAGNDVDEREVATSQLNSFVGDADDDRSEATSSAQPSTSRTTISTSTTAAPLSSTIQSPAEATSTAQPGQAQVPPPTTAAPTSTATSATTATTTAPSTTAAATSTSATTTLGCHPAYGGCIPHHPGDALNCGDLPSSQKPVTVRVISVDPYGLDGDNDGIGCESG